VQTALDALVTDVPVMVDPNVVGIA